MVGEIVKDALKALRERAESLASWRVDGEAVHQAVEDFEFRWSDFVKAVEICRNNANFDTATDVCVDSRTLWFAILRLAQLCRPVLSAELFAALIETLKEGQEVSQNAEHPTGEFLGYSVEEQLVIIRKVHRSLGNRIRSFEELRDGNPINDFIAVGTGSVA